MPDLTWRDAVFEVLKAENEPIHYAEIADKILEQNLKREVGATPADTVAAVLSTSLKQEQDDSPFERVSRGYYALRESHRESGGIPAAEPDLTEEEESETGLINAFGMYWRREAVVWNPPRLLGQQHPASEPVNFSAQRGVYLLHDRREVVYVGRTTDQTLGERLKQHTINRLNGRWDRFSWFGVYPVRDDGELEIQADLRFDIDHLIVTMEALLIEGLEPRQNRKRGDGFSAQEFIQVEDPELEKQRKKELLDQFRQSL